MTSLSSIGFDPFFQAQLDALDGGRQPARIAIDHGESYVAWTGDGVRKAVLSGRSLAAWQSAADRPQVGDWVTGTYSESTGALVIEHLLARRTCLVRRAAGERAEAQVIASNVDVVGIVSAFGGGENEARDRRLINEGRLRRYLAAVEQSGAAPVLVVNKSDLSKDPEDTARALVRLFPGVPVVLMSGQSGRGIEQLEPLVRAGQTLAFVGMSGVGKSTLVNALLGRVAQEVGAVRDSDARGRHTTTHRELFLTGSGALLIDTPGIREMGLWEIEEVTSFDDVEVLTAACRFSDCRHLTEPDCALRAALASGALSAERWTSYGQQQQRLAQQGKGARPLSEAHARGRRARHRR
ncbi:MAG TPA: ribosome small subunit-dependent GTPase A [Polyangia bacterium]|nr:ribosome small subunit-dependent GTPase A [Polyangia bacterium]